MNHRVQAADHGHSTVFDLRSKRWHEQQASSRLSFGNKVYCMAANLKSFFTIIIMIYIKVQAALDNAPKLVASRLAPRTKKLYNEV